MFESPTLSVSELAERWKKTPRQILDYAQALGVPLYFMFDGLAFDLSDRWHRENGDVDQRGELDLLRKGIARNESWIRRSVRGENGEWEQQLTTEEIQALRIEIEADKKNCEQIEELLEQRETGRKKMHHRGLMRAAPKTLFDIAQYGEARYTPKAFYPGTPVRVVNIPEQAMPIVDGRLMSLEPFEALPPLTIDSLCAVTAEVKAIEAYLKAKQTAPEPQPAPPAPVVAESAQGDEAWKERAREKAGEIIKRQKAIDAYPSQEAIADEIARAFRQDGIVGAGGKPLTGAYIKRHALKGISSELDKQLSTPIRRGK